MLDHSLLRLLLLLLEARHGLLLRRDTLRRHADILPDDDVGLLELEMELSLLVLLVLLVLQNKRLLRLKLWRTVLGLGTRLAGGDVLLWLCLHLLRRGRGRRRMGSLRLARHHGCERRLALTWRWWGWWRSHGGP